MKIAVCGTGYVGLVAIVAFAAKGYRVTGLDTDEQKIQCLQKGISPLFEPDIEELLQKHRNNVEFTCDANMAYRDADVIFIAVPTPEHTDGSANLDYVSKACTAIIESQSSAKFVVLKSTVPPGTTKEVQNYFNENQPKDNARQVISNPEFLSQGTAVKDMLYPERIIVGSESQEARDMMTQLYADFDAPLFFMDYASAEMVKYASNDFLALKISYINEIANLCDGVGANINEVAKGMGADRRIGNYFLGAGIGYGGSCFPKDTKALHWLSTHKGSEIKTIKAAIEVNTSQRFVLVEKVQQDFPNLRDKRIAILGLSFKPNTDDLRDAPSLEIVDALLQQDAQLTLYDPSAMENFRAIHPPSERINYAASAQEALRGSDMALILTEWSEIKHITVEDYLTQMNTPIIYDGRNIYDPAIFAQSQLDYISIGRPAYRGLGLSSKQKDTE